MSLYFGISVKQVGNIFITWSSKELVRFYTPIDFGHKFPNTRGILESTEFPVEQPGTPIAQQCSFSTYKNKPTVKVVVTSTPSGLTSDVLPVYGGSTSDRQII